MDGFERFAHGQLITLFSATNYCGMYLAPSSSFLNYVSFLLFSLIPFLHQVLQTTQGPSLLLAGA